MKSMIIDSSTEELILLIDFTINTPNIGETITYEGNSYLVIDKNTVVVKRGLSKVVTHIEIKVKKID